jgi:hypothetical protein
VLHAGSVLTPHGAIAFLGRSGVGKSTLTASLARAGWPLVADDFLLVRDAVDELLAVPSYPGLRLWEDTATHLFSDEDLAPVAHYTRKRRCGAGSRPLPFASAAAPLSRIYLLSPAADSGQRVAVTPLPARQAFVELARHSYRLDSDDADLLQLQFGRQGRLAARIVFRRLAYPRRFQALASVREAILADLAGPSGHA